MCEFCHRHGEGRKWYLEANNYAEDLLSDLKRRDMISASLSAGKAPKGIDSLDRLDRAPGFVRRALTGASSAPKEDPLRSGRADRGRGAHPGLRDVSGARGLHLPPGDGGTEQRYCYGVSMARTGRARRLIREIDEDYLTGLTQGPRVLSKEDTLAAFRDHEREGLCHSVWTFISPFIGASATATARTAWPCRRLWATSFRSCSGRVRGRVSPDLCNGCRQCMRACQFGAMGYSAANRKVEIDPRRCYGCGICRPSASPERSPWPGARASPRLPACGKRERYRAAGQPKE